MYTIIEIQQITKGKFLSTQNSTTIIQHLLTDSRKLLFPSNTLFFALATSHRHGNAFVNDLYDKGVRNFIVDKTFALSNHHLSGANILQVNDTLIALQQIVTYHRQQFQFPVIGITGSNGKTIVKEWLYQLLQNDFNIVRSPKSYNSQIGVPLSIWQINNQHTLGIFEAGISLPNEMKNLQNIIQPTIGIFTNIGQAHDEGFKNTTQKIKEKIKLFANSACVIYCNDDKVIDKEFIKLHNKNNIKLFSWGKSKTAILQIKNIEINTASAIVTAVFNDTQISICIPFTNYAAIENAITCWCVLLYLNISNKKIQERILQLKSVAMRLELKEGINNCSIINDSYSADITSLSIALDFLQQQLQHNKSTVILSDILQSGKPSAYLYKEVANILQQKKIHRLIGIGTEIAKHSQIFCAIKETFFFNSVAHFLQQFSTIHFYNENILLKGARIFEFEQISHLLEQQRHQTVLEINLTAIAHNLKWYQQQLKPGVKLMAMVKAFSYGSGSYEIANILQFYKVDYLAVAYVDEAVELRRAGITLPIMVMNAEVSTFDLLVQYNVEPELFSWGILQSFKNYLQQLAVVNYPVHIKLDTGMHRLGFEETDIEKLSKLLLDNNTFKIQSVFSHLAASENKVHDDFTTYQEKLFLKCCAIIQKNINYTFLKHIANTSAIHRHKNMQLNMVRLGIGLYGIDSTPAVQQQLKNVSTLKTTIAQIKKIKAGDSIGYSRKGIAEKNSVIATVRIGYADGYPRNLGNGVGKMLLKEKLVPVIGNVCMDMIMLDITGIDANEGDEVIAFGEKLSVSKLANCANTISYEILTGISQRVKRIYFEE